MNISRQNGRELFILFIYQIPINTAKTTIISLTNLADKHAAIEASKPMLPDKKVRMAPNKDIVCLFSK